MSATAMTFEIQEEDLQAKNQAEWYRLRAERLRREGQQAEPHNPQDDAAEVFELPDLEFQPKVNWLIRDFVEERGLLAFYGKPKSGKTAFLASMLWAWVAGMDWWFDERFQFSDPAGKAKGDRKVLYVILEGQQAFWYRAKAWCDAYEVNMETQLRNFLVMQAGLSLFAKGLSREDRSRWPMSLKLLWNRILADRPDILVLDTFSRATGGIDENSSEVATVVGVLDDMRDEFDLTTIIVHHSPKSDKTILRGHSSLEGAASSLIYTERLAGYNNLVLAGFRNAAPVGEKIPFTMKAAEDYFYVTEVDPGILVKGHDMTEVVGLTLEQAAAKLKVSKKTVWNYVGAAPGLHSKDGVIVYGDGAEPEVL